MASELNKAFVMDKQHSIAFKLQDFSSFVNALTAKMVEAVEKTKNSNTILDLRTFAGDVTPDIFNLPITLRDYLDIWEQVTETLKTKTETFIDFYANVVGENYAEYIDVTLWIRFSEDENEYVYSNE